MLDKATTNITLGHVHQLNMKTLDFDAHLGSSWQVAHWQVLALAAAHMGCLARADPSSVVRIYITSEVVCMHAVSISSNWTQSHLGIHIYLGMHDYHIDDCTLSNFG